MSVSSAWTRVAGVLVTVILLFWLSSYNFLLFHTTIELFSAMVTGCVFILTMTLADSSLPAFFAIIGCGQGAVAGFTLLHMLAYKGMGMLSAGGANLATQLWIAARLVDAGSLCVGAFLIGRTVRIAAVLGSFAMITLALLASLFVWPVFPDCFIEGSGLTPFKIAMEYAVIGILAWSLWLLRSQRNFFSAVVLRRLAGAYMLRIIAELIFTSYKDVFDISNVLGHLAVFASYWLLAAALVRHLVREPQVVSFQNLYESEVKFRSLSENSPDYIRRYDSQGRHLYINPAGLRVSGLKEADLIGKTHQESGFSEEECVFREDRIRGVFETGQPYSTEFEWNSVEGPVVLDWRLNPEFGTNGRVTTVLGVSRDITERKQAQQALRLALLEANSANRMKSAFVANVSHEIRTPMNAILGFTEILLQDPLLTPVQKGHLETIGHSGEHLLELINDVLEISKIESGLVTFNPTDFDVHLVIRDLESMFHAKASEKSLTLSLEVDPSVPASIVTDKQKLRQILINLIGNAIKFTQEGEVTVRLWAEQLSESPGELRLFADIEDTGPGIAAKELETLFRAFYQGEAGKIAGGTGMGLAISRNFAEKMGGQITVTSQFGAGSCFHFEFLATQGKECRNYIPDKKIIGLAAGQKACRILIVDDEELNRQILGNILGNIGFETRQAADGEEAVAEFAKWGPDLVLMDVQMPRMDGYEVTRRIKCVARDKNVHVIGVSAGVFEENRKRALACGMDAFITKPFKSQDLLHTIAGFLCLQYVYGESSATQPRVVMDSGAMDSELGKIPRALSAQIRACSVSADYEELMKWIDKTETYSPALTVELRHFAGNYDYETLGRVMERITP